MAQITLLPEGTGTLNQFAVFGTRPSAIRTIDLGATYVWSRRDFAKTDRILMEDLPAEAATITQVQGTYWFQKSGTGDNCNVRVGFYDTSVVWGTLRATAGWAGATDTFATAPGGGAWSVANVNSAQLTVYEDGSSSSSNAVEVTYYAGIVDYELASGGGFFFLLGCLALGAFICQADFDRFLDWRAANQPKTRITQAERATAWTDVREYRHPTFFIPGGVD